MSEPGYLSASQDSGGGDEVFAAVGHKVQTLIPLVSELVTTWSHRAAEKARGLQAAAESADRAHHERLKALRGDDMPLMRQVWDERWWEHATADEIGLAWETTGGWARNGDPYARRTQERLREQIKNRFGVELDAEPVSSTLVAEVLAGSEAARPVGFVIRGPESGTTAERGTLSLPADDRRPIGVVAADRLGEFSAGRQDAAEPTGRYVIEVYDGGLPGGERRFVLGDDQAAALRAEYDQWAQGVLEGTEPAPLDRVRDVLQVERHRLRQELARLRETDPRVVAARETLADERAIQDGSTNPRITGRPSVEGLSVEDHAAQVAAITEQLADIQLRLEQVQADLLGEDPALVTQAAILRRDLDPEWWATATPEEVAGIWTHVDGWARGEAKLGVREELQGQILRRHGVDVGPGASFEKVSSELHRAQAQARGERVLRFRIESPAQATHHGDGDAIVASARTVEATGQVTAPTDEPLHQLAARQLHAYAGSLEAAPGQGLIIRVFDYAGVALGAFDASGQLLDASGQLFEEPQHATQTPQDHRRPESAHDTSGADHAKGAKGAQADPVPWQAQDLMDPDALKRIAGTDPQAAEAVQAATTSRHDHPYSQTPLDVVGGTRRSTKSGLGPRRPRPWRRLHRPGQPER